MQVNMQVRTFVFILKIELYLRCRKLIKKIQFEISVDLWYSNFNICC